MGRQVLIGAAFLALVAVGVWQQRGLSAQATRTEQLYAGCNNIAITHDAGTPLSTVAQGISGSLISIFRYDNAQSRFFGWAPNVPEYAIDYQSVSQRLEPVFVCMSTNGQIVQPAAPGPGSTATTTATAAATATPTIASAASPTPAVTPTPFLIGVTATPSTGGTPTPGAGATPTPTLIGVTATPSGGGS